MFDRLELTEDDIAKTEASLIIAQSNIGILGLQESLTICFNLVWNNPKTSPQKIFDALGTQAAKTFSDSRLVQQLLKSLNPDFQYLIPPYGYTINEDGTVTVGDKNE